MTFYVVFDSVTYATKAKRTLETMGIAVNGGNARLNTPACSRGYTLEIRDRDINSLKLNLAKSGIKYRKIISESRNGYSKEE